MESKQQPASPVVLLVTENSEKKYPRFYSAGHFLCCNFRWKVHATSLQFCDIKQHFSVNDWHKTFQSYRNCRKQLNYPRTERDFALESTYFFQELFKKQYIIHSIIIFIQPSWLQQYNYN